MKRKMYKDKVKTRKAKLIDAEWLTQPNLKKILKGAHYKIFDIFYWV